MIEIKDKSKCSGCSACYSVCPKNCISMIEDEEGFLYPKANKDDCINCGLCEKVCPLEEHNNKKNGVVSSCIIQNKDKEVLLQSTSGGSFTTIAEYVLRQNGVVFGVEMTSDDFIIRHTKVEKKEELLKFRSSKYVQSSVGDTFKDAKNELENGRMVCFSGTPCQIQGFKNFLKKDYENLITVDVVCRGVPSPGMWRDYVEKLQQLDKVQEVVFRDKGLGYQYSTMKVKYANGTVKRNGIESDQWLRMFFSGLSLRPSCPTCNFRTTDRCSDFTIWDCFNVSDLTNALDETKGATRMLIHTQKGMQIFDKIKCSFNFVEAPTNVVAKGIKETFFLNKNRNNFISDYRSMSMDSLLEKWVPMSVKVYLKKYTRRVLNVIGLDLIVKKVKRKIKG
ncbi:Coenzyme F420 hydrogenase/dehydrogenase, beta subunit C-terminal domain [Agathobacter sp. LCP21S3_B2]|uniref:Coenzyme F420 hydrogenase/dehydrogenase, beta subunit C-terminal domain n=1 Tax=Agathobacter sp. LCP21S3_B2 TaxID=3438734 RepID=UPI003F922F77